MVSFMWGREILDEGLRWSVGNEKRIWVYGDKWIPRDTVSFIISPQNLNMNCIVDQLLSSLGE
ncbi:hypothetical protein Ddye_009047 [Dipteronia dyeriana]|uniref:Uncharacterized protein n=1 Tax=Dipteronia dyeriana TaxID=168575 RepID=A0AAD9XAN1_9ROSI|nr:hypothetical protein Ddye_009047 [Dipteronia dyeriana]